MAETRVIGIGSPFGADQLGWLALDVLRQRLPMLSSVELLPCRFPAELPNLLTGCSRAILLDALQGGFTPGSLQRFALAELPQSGLGVSSHGMDVAAALQLAKVLGSLPQRLIVLGIEVGKENQPVNPVWIERLIEEVLAELSRSG